MAIEKRGKMFESISRIDVYVGIALNGVFAGLGASLGSYLANKHLIERSKKIIRRLRGEIRRRF